MESPEIVAMFGPAAGNPEALSKACRKTLQALYQHPIAHNLEWSNVIALFEAVGAVDQGSHNEFSFHLGGAHHRIHKPHGKDLSADEVMAFRHMLSRAGWSPPAPAEPTLLGNGRDPVSAAGALPPSLLIAVQHHETRLYRLEVNAADPIGDVIRPYDPHHFLHHLSHKDLTAERGQRSPEDPSYYKRLAEAIAPAGSIVVIGHATGHSNAAHHLVEYLRRHHPETFQKVICEIVADLGSFTPPQLLVLGRRALSAPSNEAAEDHSRAV